MKTRNGYFTEQNSSKRTFSVPNKTVTPGISSAFSKGKDALGMKPGKIVDSNLGGESAGDKQKQIISGVPKQPNRVVGY
jgi:hypothetical protein